MENNQLQILKKLSKIIQKNMNFVERYIYQDDGI